MFDAQTLFITKFISFHTWFVLGVIIVSMISYAWEKIPLELTSLLTITSLLLFFHFFPLYDLEGNESLNLETIFRGFADPALIAIISLLIVGQAVIQSNALDIVPKIIMKLTAGNAMVSIIFSLLIVVIISAFMNNTPVVVIFIPILAQIAKNLNIAPSKVMIPLSYAAIVGGMLTLIGSSTNLLISGAVQGLGLSPLGFFEFFVPGMMMASVGMVYIFFILPKILPNKNNINDEVKDERNFVSQIIITAESGLVDKRLEEGSLKFLKNIRIRVLYRDGVKNLPPFQDDLQIKEGDTITISGTRDELSQLIYKKPKIFINNLHIEEDFENTGEQVKLSEANLAEVVVAPASRMIGQAIKKSGFYHDYHCPVIGVQRRGDLIRERMSDIRLMAGDVLLILGGEKKLLEFRNDKDVILTKWSAQEVSSKIKMFKTLFIFATAIICASLKIIPISMAAFAAASALLLLKTINIRQASRAIDGNIALLIVSSIALGGAMQATGGADLVAKLFLKTTAGLDNIAIISIFFLFVVFMTNILSNAATAVLFTPIAANLAVQVGMDPKIFIYALIFASNCSFITPMGYQTNLLVMSPGRYRFLDFVKGGTPLALLMCVTYTMLVIYYF